MKLILLLYVTEFKIILGPPYYVTFSLQPSSDFFQCANCRNYPIENLSYIKETFLISTFTSLTIALGSKLRIPVHTVLINPV